MARYTRVTVTHPTHRREIFKVRDLPKGDLVILLPKDYFHSFPDSFGPGAGSIPYKEGIHHHVSERKFSVHVTGNATNPGTLIKHQVLSKQTGLYETAQYVHHANGNLFTEIYVAMVPLSHKQINVKSGPAQIIHNIGDYDPYTTTLMYGIFVSDGRTDIPEFPGQLVLPFSHFTLYVYHTFIPFRSPPFEISFLPVTSDARLNSGPIKHTITDCNGLDPGFLVESLQANWRNLNRSYEVFLGKTAHMHGISPSVWKCLSRQFGRKTPA